MRKQAKHSAPKVGQSEEYQSSGTASDQVTRSPLDRFSTLHRTLGNQAVGRLIRQSRVEGRNSGVERQESGVKSQKTGEIQPKLIINRPNDIYEQEADRVAEQVMRTPKTVTEGQGRAEAKAELGPQRQAVPAHDASIADAPPIVHEALSTPGQPLDAQTRAFFEPRFGHDFSQVRVHADAKADESARAIGANAYTTGRDIAFMKGRYQPTMEKGVELIAHELMHVVQQRRGVSLRDATGEQDDVHERQANAAANRVMRGWSTQYKQDACPASGNIEHRTLQRQRERTPSRTQIERGQTWDPTILESETPLAPAEAEAAPGIVEAIRKTVDLGFTDDKIRKLRHALGLSARRSDSIDRDLILAIRDRQATASESIDVSLAATGVLDEPTVFLISVGANLLEGRRAEVRDHYKTIWRNVEETFAGTLQACFETAFPFVRREIIITFFEPVPNFSRGNPNQTCIEVSDEFLVQVANWQFWNHRAGAVAVWGKLLDMDLKMLCPTIAGSAAAEQTPPEAAPPAPIAAEVTTVAAAEPVLEQGGEPRVTSQTSSLDAAQRERWQHLKKMLWDYLNRRWDSRHDVIRSAEIDNEYASVIEEAINCGIENEWMICARQRRRGGLQNQARYARDGILAALGEQPDRDACPAGRQAAGAETDQVGTTPMLSRVGRAVAERHLLESRVTIEPGTRLTTEWLVPGLDGWDPRVLPGGRADGDIVPHDVVIEFAERCINGLELLKEELTNWRDELTARMGGNIELLWVLEDLSAVAFHAPTTLGMHFWRPTFPAPPTPRDWADLSRAQGTARRWCRQAREVIDGAERQLARHRAIIARASMAIDNPEEYRTTYPPVEAVRVDLRRSGVMVTSNTGGNLTTQDMLLDIYFADAMLRFLEMLRGLGATQMWTAGFSRPLGTLQDPHPAGQGCDITGFQFGQHVLHLGNGEKNPGEYPAEATGVRGEYSDWYNHTTKIRTEIGEKTYSEILHALTARMAMYFSRITGPGHDTAHNTHWHVELLTENRVSLASPRIQAIQVQSQGQT